MWSGGRVWVCGRVWVWWMDGRGTDLPEEALVDGPEGVGGVGQEAHLLAALSQVVVLTRLAPAHWGRRTDTHC